MNIKITHNWLLDYLDTDASPDEIREYLSLCGPSIESVEKIKDDYVYDIEVISNRIDYASVFGIAQESVAILPMFGKKAILKSNPFEKYKLNLLKEKDNLKLTVKIEKTNLCQRFTAIIIDNVKIGPSPKFVSQRLIDSGIKSINNVVDISNYLMLTLGQPVHVFDYDKIGKATMIMRESKKGEKIITLDKKEVTLPGGDIVVEDGNGDLIDLCGIMGGLNSSIGDTTKRVVLFVQTYNKERIRKTTMTTGVRTVAATYFEKGLDEERVEATTTYGVELFEKFTSGRVASKLYDLYPNPHKPGKIVVQFADFQKLIGIEIDKKIIVKILENLGFKTEKKNNSLEVVIPSYRKYDISIIEDLVEEVARVYGYHNIPSILQPAAYVGQPKNMEDLFVFQNRIKIFLKHLGLNEVINYSMISKSMIEGSGLKIENHLRLSNSISADIEFLRISLLPSLEKNIKENKGRREVLQLFEIAKVYIKDGPYKESPCNEVYRLGVAVNSNYFDLKGIIEALYRELNIDGLSLPEIIEKDGVFMAEIDFQSLIVNCKLVPKYKPINPYAVIKLDKTFEIQPTTTYEVVRQKALHSKLLQKIEVVTLYQNKLTLRFYYSSPEGNITEEEAKKELYKVRP